MTDRPEGDTTSRTDPPIGIDLFSGAGGFAEGLAAAGVEIAAAVELHPQPALTHAFNHPLTQVFAGDIRDLDLALLEDALLSRTNCKVVDVVVGGPPCQGFSTAGRKREGDPRNNLFLQFARVVQHFRPRMFVLENVPGFKTMYGGKIFHEATQIFQGLGYELTNNILSAPDFGAPQRRRRFFLVGFLADRIQEFRWPVPSHQMQASQGELGLPDLSDYESVEAALDDLAFLRPGWEAHRHQQDPRFDFARERRTGDPLLFNHLATQHRPKAIALFRKIGEGCTVASVPEAERPRKATMARMDRKRVSNAVLALPDDMIHYRQDRIPTVREMARLQTFDDNYVFIGKRTSGFVERRVDVPQYTQVGNAVPPLLARAIGSSIVSALGASPRDLRDVSARLARHDLVRGSSAYSGYSLSPAADQEIDLLNVFGGRLPLPTSDEDKPVSTLAAVVKWTRRRPTRRGQWVPDTKAAPNLQLPDAQPKAA